MPHDVARYLSQNEASDLLSYEGTAQKQLSRLQDMDRVNGKTARNANRIVNECIFPIVSLQTSKLLL